VKFSDTHASDPRDLLTADVWCVAEVPYDRGDGTPGSWRAWDWSHGVRASAAAMWPVQHIEIIRPVITGTYTTIVTRMRLWGHHLGWPQGVLAPGSTITIDTGIASQLVSIGAADPAA